MLTKGEQDYLDSLSEEARNRIVHIKPFNPAIKEMADVWMSKIRQQLPGLKVILTGSLAYGIAGEEDVDISIFCPLEEHEKYRPILDKLLGKYESILSNHTAWFFYQNDVHVGVWLVDQNRSQTMMRSKRLLDAFSNPELVKEYEKVKLSMNGKTYREYQTAKYEFYHKVIGEE